MTIYRITNKANGKHYIGGTTQYYNQRKAQHKWFLRNDRHPNGKLQSDWNRFGEETFEFSIIEQDIQSVQELRCLESLYAFIYDVEENGYHEKTIYNYSSCKGDKIKNTKTNIVYDSIAKAFMDTGIMRQTLTAYCKDSNNLDWVYIYD